MRAGFTTKEEAASDRMQMFDDAIQPEEAGDLGLFASPAGRSDDPSDNDLQRSNGYVRIALGGSKNGTHLIDLLQRSPVRVMFPKVDGGAIREVVLANTAGGIAGGDRLETDVAALPNASFAVTSQAAEKIYRALDKPARIETKLNVCKAAKLAWLPQETIVFDRARLSRETQIDLVSGAEMIALEWLVMGRAAHGEEMSSGHIADHWRVRKDNRLIWADCFRVGDDVFPHLGRSALLSDCKAIGTLVYFGPYAYSGLERLRSVISSLECRCAATSVGGLTIMRFAAAHSSGLKIALRSVLQQFNREHGGAPFGVPKMWSC